jgi:hypothetical protein
MRAPVRALLVTSLVFAAACGKEIGDSCIVSSDCSVRGDRQCDPGSPDGYCTIQGCDYNTCPSEAECVRFFVGDFENVPCDPTQPNAMTGCSLDELCTLTGNCAPRSAEVRYCMRKCNHDGDCRTPKYECRDLQRMKDHGGEPVLAPGDSLGAKPQGFCAAAPVTAM